MIDHGNDAILKHGTDALMKCVTEMRNIVNEHALKEGFTDNHRGDLERKMDELENKLITTTRMLGKINGAQLSPEDKLEHKKRIMVNMNMFRRQLIDTMLEMGMNPKEINYHMDRIKMDTPYGKPNDVFKPNPDEEKGKFSALMNQKRNMAQNPDEMGEFVKPKVKTGDNHKRWYQRIFGK